MALGLDISIAEGPTILASRPERAVYSNESAARAGPTERDFFCSIRHRKETCERLFLEPDNYSHLVAKLLARTAEHSPAESHVGRDVAVAQMQRALQFRRRRQRAIAASIAAALFVAGLVALYKS